MDINSERPLHIAPCGHDAAKYAVVHWHYSQAMPAGRLAHYGVWEHGRFVGVIIFGYGAAPQIRIPFGVAQKEVCELVRIALKNHITPVSKMAAVTMRLLKKRMIEMRLIVSYADSEQGHVGGIYKAGNWIYVGRIQESLYIVHGKRVHSRNIREKYKGKTPLMAYLRRYVDPRARKLLTPFKHKYVMPLDKEMRMRVEQMRKPYPKRATSIGADAPAFQAGEGGSQPTVALQLALAADDEQTT